MTMREGLRMTMREGLRTTKDRWLAMARAAPKRAVTPGQPGVTAEASNG